MPRHQIILWRHADAEDFCAAGDTARALTTRGQKQAAKMAKWLLDRMPAGIRIIVSPAVRTQQTAAALGLPFDTDARLAVGASAQDVLTVARWPKRDSVLIIGHQPTLGQTASLLLRRLDADFSVKKGAILWMEDRNGRDAPMYETVLRAAIAPDMLD